MDCLGEVFKGIEELLIKKKLVMRSVKTVLSLYFIFLPEFGILLNICSNLYANNLKLYPITRKIHKMPFKTSKNPKNNFLIPGESMNLEEIEEIATEIQSTRYLGHRRCNAFGKEGG